MFAKEFGWTPEQVDKLGIRRVMSLICFYEAVKKKEMEEIKKNG